jgi:uncharacterized delta-60 repeat protein
MKGFNMKTLTSLVGCFLLIMISSFSVDAQERKRFNNSLADSEVQTTSIRRGMDYHKDFIKQKDEGVSVKINPDRKRSIPPYVHQRELMIGKHHPEMEQQNDLLNNHFEKKRRRTKWESIPSEVDKFNRSPSIPGIEFNSQFDSYPENSSSLQGTFSTDLSAGADPVDQAWVSHYASGLISSDDFAVDIAIDKRDRSIIVTGSSDKDFTGNDFLTIKYAQDGDSIWTARYDGGSEYDDATGVVIDYSGNVYVTGRSFGSGTGWDYATIKYNPDGVEQWVERYNGSGNSSDEARAISVDPSGNVYVTGYSYGSGTDRDYATIKYNPDGVEQWVARYNGSGNSKDEAYGVSVDRAGNVYVTGKSVGAGTEEDYATIKYNTDGVQQWIARYNGSGNSNDEANAISLDSLGNVCVTGKSVGAGTNWDYATIKYNSDGVEQWVARYNGPGNSADGACAISVEPLGNVYVTGSSMGSGTYYDYATIKYNINGAQQWVARYNGPGNIWDFAYALSVDYQGNVYVTGNSYGGPSTSDDIMTIVYNTNGTQKWARRFTGPPGFSDQAAYAIVVDSLGYAYITGYSSYPAYDYLTVKYSPLGGELWVAMYAGPGNSIDGTHASTIDPLGNVYVTGYSTSSGTSRDYLTIKYNSDGIEQWVARYNGTGNIDDEAYAISIDRLGNVYVTGYSYGPETYKDYVTIKYNSVGVEQWVARYNGTGNIDDEAYAISVDSFGNVYVTGYCGVVYNQVGYTDYVTIKYDANGIQQWIAMYNGPGNSYDQARAISVADEGNVYVTGYSYGSGTSGDYATIKYNTDGVQQWVTRYDGPGNYWDYALAITVDQKRNVYVTGLSSGSGTSDDFATIKYDTNGVQQWVVRYNGSGNSDDYANAISVDRTGNVYVSGNSVGSGTSSDYSTIKYDSNGVEQWVARYNGTGNSVDEVHSMAVDRGGNVYVTGQSAGLGTYADYATIKYNSSGVEQWVARYRTLPVYYHNSASAISIDYGGNIYVTGTSFYDWRSFITTIKYEQSPSFGKSTNEITFGSVPVACNKIDSFYITNDGGGQLVINSILIDDLSFTILPNDSTINPYDSVWFSVLFDPSDSGGKNGRIVFNHNGFSLTDTILVNGVGTGDPFVMYYGTGWQLISLPVSAICTHAPGDLFEYLGSYVGCDTLKNEKGYWKKLIEPELSFAGLPILADTITVNAHWNIIGSISNPISVNSITSIPQGIISSPFYKYYDSYQVTDSIIPGHGYWVKVSEDGELVLSSTDVVNKSLAQFEFLKNYNEINIRDSRGRNQTLFFGICKSQPQDWEWCELPPIPPEGNFDVRYASGRIVEVIGNGEEFPIEISSAEYPIMVSWSTARLVEELDSPKVYSSIMIDGKEIFLIKNGSTSIAHRPSRIALRFIGTPNLPKEFALEQNYPNPFNPTTIIRYQLPANVSRDGILTYMVSLRVYNMLGQEIATLVDEMQDAGYKSVNFDAAILPSGVYIYRFKAGNPAISSGKWFTDMKKMIVLR